MRKLTLLTFLALTLALPLQAARNKGQSYFSYDDGGTIVRQGEDGREVDARVNLPVFPGDEVVTDRRGRAEIRLSDGNVIGLDRGTAVRFKSILDSYEGDASESIVELRYGKLAVYRTGEGRETIRIDTPSATYFASTGEAVFSVESDAHGKDRASVLQGAIEVRTPSRNTRLRAGESANIDDRGLSGLVSDQGYEADDFESWFLRRAERYGGATSRYLDRSLAYSDEDLSRNGSWVNVSGYGWGWRPHVSVGWRPYYHGHWSRARSGFLNWVSYEPWGWVPYHYGRWSYDPYYGWFWLPGIGYAPAWVYWWYGSGYLGWAPAGYYDCYRPYYNWAYRPFANHGLAFGYGFHGRVRVNEIDLRPWTFIDSNTIVSTRIDRAALTTDVIRGRLQRETGGMATISSGPARMINERLADPTTSINRRWVGTDTGRESAGPIGDVTPFFRRDAEISGTIRDRIVRTRPADGTTTTTRGGNLAPIGGGSVAPIGGGSAAPIGGGSAAPIGGSTRSDTGVGRINRGGGSSRPVEQRTTPAPAPARESDTPSTWRDRLDRPQRSPRTLEPTTTVTPSETPEPREQSWRGRVQRGNEFIGRDPNAAPVQSERPRTNDGQRSPDRSSDVPRRIIDRIGGARIAPSDPGRSSSPRESSPPPRRDSGSSTRSAPPPPPPARESSPPPQSKDGGGGGKIKRGHE